MQSYFRFLLYACCLHTLSSPATHASSYGIKGTCKHLITWITASTLFLCQGYAFPMGDGHKAMESNPEDLDEHANIRHLLSTGINETTMMPTEYPTYAPTLGWVQVIDTIPTQTMQVGDYFVYQVVPTKFFQTSDGGPLTLHAKQQGREALPSCLTFNTMTDIFSAAPSNADIGSYIILLMAVNAQGRNASLVFTVNVREKRDALVVLAPFIGPTIAGFCVFILTVCCTARFCKIHEENQKRNLQLLQETHDMVNSDKEAIEKLANNNRDTIVQLNDFQYTTKK